MAQAGSGRLPGGEGNSDPIYLTCLFQHFGLDKIGDIMNRPDGKTFQQRIVHLREELDAFERACDIFHMVKVDDDEEEDENEDETDENVGQMLLGDEDEEKPDIATLSLYGQRIPRGT